MCKFQNKNIPDILRVIEWPAKAHEKCSTASHAKTLGTPVLDQYNMKKKFSIAPSLPGITASHCITIERGESCLHRLSVHANASPAKSALPSSSSPKEGEWVVVIYDDNFVLGEIAKACNQTITVNFIEKLWSKQVSMT